MNIYIFFHFVVKKHIKSQQSTPCFYILMGWEMIKSIYKGHKKAIQVGKEATN